MRKRDYLTDPKYDVATISPRDGIFSVYPTLFQNKDGSWIEKDDRDNWGSFERSY